MTMSVTTCWVCLYSEYIMESPLCPSGAQEAGLLGGLVRTGKYRPGDEDKWEQKPHFVFNDLMEMAKMLE